jgi:hypothetical protein
MGLVSDQTLQDLLDFLENAQEVYEEASAGYELLQDAITAIKAIQGDPEAVDEVLQKALDKTISLVENIIAESAGQLTLLQLQVIAAQLKLGALLADAGTKILHFHSSCNICHSTEMECPRNSTQWTPRQKNAQPYKKSKLVFFSLLSFTTVTWNVQCKKGLGNDKTIYTLLPIINVTTLGNNVEWHWVPCDKGIPKGLA